VNWLFVFGHVIVTGMLAALIVLHNLLFFAHKLVYLTFDGPVCENSPGIVYDILFEMFLSNP